jgi:hypothetical protein
VSYGERERRMASGTDAEPGRVSAATGSDRPPLLTWRDIERGTRRYADELIATEAESTALEALRTATGEVHGDMERHTMRQYLIAERIAEQESAGRCRREATRLPAGVFGYAGLAAARSPPTSVCRIGDEGLKPLKVQ